MTTSDSIALFEGKEIRKLWHNNERWFVIVDVVGIISESKDPSGYIKDMRRRDKELFRGWGQIATPLTIQTKGGKQKWKARGITDHKDYAILTAEISKATFGMTPSEYKQLKHIPHTSKTNLRDNTRGAKRGSTLGVGQT